MFAEKLAPPQTTYKPPAMTGVRAVLWSESLRLEVKALHGEKGFWDAGQMWDALPGAQAAAMLAGERLKELVSCVKAEAMNKQGRNGQT